MLRHPVRWLFALCVVVLGADQITKSIVRGAISPGESRVLIPDLLGLTYVMNSGAAFGLMPGKRALFVGISLLVLAAVAVYWWRERPRRWFVVTALAFVASGALGNLIDRVLVGHVTDFLEFLFMDFPVFNIADSAIVAGTGILIVWLLFAPESLDSAVEGATDDQPAAEATP